MIQTSMKEIMSGLTVNCKVEVTGIRLFKIRFFIARLLFKLAAKALGAGIKIEENK